MQTALLAVLSALVGALIWVVKALVARGDKAQAARDGQMATLIKSLTRSVEAFAKFEVEERGAHGKIVTTQEAIQHGLEANTRALEALAAKVGEMCRAP